MIGVGMSEWVPPEVNHIIRKDQTQQLERTNGIVRQQTGLGHRRQNKFGKIWEQTEVSVRLVVSYFNWILVHSRKGNTAAQRAELTFAVVMGRTHYHTLDLERPAYLSHTLLMHYQRIHTKSGYYPCTFSRVLSNHACLLPLACMPCHRNKAPISRRI